MNDELLRLYKYTRRGNWARPALEFAKARLARGEKEYSNEWPWQRGAGNVTRQEKKHPGDNYAWIENTESAGLRFVGYCDDICQNIRHKGWYTDEDGLNGETLRGAVWQLPARHGIARYIAGYEDPCNEGAAFVDLDIIGGEGGYSIRWSGHGEPEMADQTRANEDSKREAALRADSIAERNAEREREYNAAWHAGSRWSDLGDEIAKERAFTLALLVESRPERHAMRATATPHICEAIRATVRRAVDHIADMRKERAELFDNYGRHDGFAEHLPRA
jgi:hypothetical protein